MALFFTVTCDYSFGETGSTRLVFPKWGQSTLVYPLKAPDYSESKYLTKMWSKQLDIKTLNL